jgi:hypothetical protein
LSRGRGLGQRLKARSNESAKSNTSPILKLFLSRLDELAGPNQKD